MHRQTRYYKKGAKIAMVHNLESLLRLKNGALKFLCDDLSGDEIWKLYCAVEDLIIHEKDAMRAKVASG